jgi:phage terminase large subunit-like protein
MTWSLVNGLRDSASNRATHARSWHWAPRTRGTRGSSWWRSDSFWHSLDGRHAVGDRRHDYSGVDPKVRLSKECRAAKLASPLHPVCTRHQKAAARILTAFS